MPPAPVIVPVNCASDATETSWPNGPNSEYVPADPAPYLTRLAQKYMIDTGQAQTGVKYVLDKLPDGYALFGKHRLNDPKHIDRYLCGNPKYKYRSVEEFYEHFQNLMLAGNVQSCKCRACSGNKRRTNAEGLPAVKRAKKAAVTAISEIINVPDGPLPQLQAHQKALGRARPRVDEEGVPDVVSMLIDRLKADAEHTAFDEPVTQLDSLDWLINRSLVKEFVKETRTKPRWMPRIGEIVLFHRSLGPSDFVGKNPRSGRFERFVATSGVFVEDNDWEAGVIAEMPVHNLDISELATGSRNQKLTHWMESSFRVEPMPEIGASEKPWSKRSLFVALCQTRPFFMFRDLLGDTPEGEYHATVKHSLTALSSFCLLSPFFFRAKWPTATVFHRGMYLGAELLMVGDIVRLAPNGDVIEDILRITAIKSKFVGLDGEDPSTRGGDEPSPEVHKTCIHVSGIAYTSNRKRSWSSVPATTDFGIGEYGPWYHLHDPAKRWEQPFSSVIGRCYEGPAMLQLLHGPGTKATADDTARSIGLAAVRDARRSTTDPRIAEGKSWFWADSRVEQLDLHQVNEQMVAEGPAGELNRDPAAWIRALKVRAQAVPLKAVEPSQVASSGGDKLGAVAPAPVIDLDAEDDEVTDGKNGPQPSVTEDLRASRRAIDPSELEEMLGGIESGSDD